jgi:hypothetical protein
MVWSDVLRRMKLLLEISKLQSFAVKSNFLNPLAEGGAEKTEKNETVELLDDNIRKGGR